MKDNDRHPYTMYTHTQLKAHVRESFDHIRKALDLRENLLIRQIDVLFSQPHQNIVTIQQQKQTSTLIEKIEFVRENEENVLNNIRLFGRISYHMTNNFFVMEDYICPNVDHELMYKNLNDNNEISTEDGTIASGEQIFVDFSLLKKKGNSVNHSIVNITLNESRELIEKSKISSLGDYSIDPSNSLLITPDIVEVIEGKNGNISNEQTFKPKMASTYKFGEQYDGECNNETNNMMNNTENVVDIEKEIVSPAETVEQSEASSHNMSPEQNEQVDTNAGESLQYISQCEFYNRLIAEIKNSLLRHTDKKPNSSRDKCSASRTFNVSSSAASNEPTAKESKCSSARNTILFKNIKNLKINIPINNRFTPGSITAEKRCPKANKSDSIHPVQIDQWLKQIISETEIEPMPNIGILEHNDIQNS